MKIKALFLTLLLSCLYANTYAQSTYAQSTYVKNTYAKNTAINLEPFVGAWSGEYVHKNQSRRDSWIQTRKADGTFKLVYKTFQYGVLSSTEINEGTWWLEGEYFYEQQSGKHDKADKYLYELSGGDKIKFTEISTNEKTSELIQGYSFTDTRVEQ